MPEKYDKEKRMPFEPARARPYWCDIYGAVLREDGDWLNARGDKYLGGFLTFESAAIPKLIREGVIEEGEPVITYRRSTSGRAPNVGAWVLRPGWQLPDDV